MNTAAIEATMPAQTVPEPSTVLARPTGARTTVCTAVPKPATPARASSESARVGDVQARLTAANERAAALEELLAAAVAGRDAAEHQAAQLQDRNRELASDLDDALDQLAGHALHAEQERLIRTPAWSPWTASSEREGYDR